MANRKYDPNVLLCIMFLICKHDDFRVILVSAPDNFITFQRSNSGFVMHTYRKCKCKIYFFHSSVSNILALFQCISKFFD